MQQSVPKASTMTLQTLMYVAVSLQPPFLTFPYPTPPRQQTPGRVPEHFIFVLHAIFAMQLLKSFLIGVCCLTSCFEHERVL